MASTPFPRVFTRRALLRTLGSGLLVAAGIFPLAAPAQAKKDCGTYTVTIGARTFSGKQDTRISARDVAGQIARVRGTFTEFDVDLDTFTVRNYTMTGVPASTDITRRTRTVIYLSKVPEHNSILTGDLSLRINNEQLVLSRTGPVTPMKIQAKDCTQGGIFQMEPDRTIPVVHTLAQGFRYFVDSLGRVLFTNGIFVGRESPETATLVAPGKADIPGQTQSRWLIQGGGRMGMVLGEDATQP